MGLDSKAARYSNMGGRRLTESGNFVILNNGIEFAATYMIMLSALMVLGGGRYVSLDFWIKRSVMR
jgi:hypothetical protein